MSNVAARTDSARLVVSEVVRPVDADPYAWLPFLDEQERYTLGWWTDCYHLREATGSRWFVACHNGVEVGRVEVDAASGEDYYMGSAVLGDGPILDIEFIDVAVDFRRRGAATAIVQHLISAFPGHRLVAFSEDADAFWSSLGWLRIEHPDGDALYRPLFVQPLES